MAVATSLLDSFSKRLQGLVSELPGLELGRDEALHRARVASRRLRELLPLLELDADVARKLTRQLRTVTRRLGRVRELDVLMQLVDELERSGLYAGAAVMKLQQAIGQQREAARKRLGEKLPPSKIERLAEKLTRAVDSGKPGGRQERGSGEGGATRSWLWALDARMARRATRVRNAIELAGAMYASEPLHGVRIALKKLRYAAELSLEAGRPRLKADIAALKSGQDLLGRLHDYETLIAAVRQMQASTLWPDVTVWPALKTLVRGIEDDCRQMHARYMRDRARLIAVADRLGAGQSSLPRRASRAAG